MYRLFMPSAARNPTLFPPRQSLRPISFSCLDMAWARTPYDSSRTGHDNTAIGDDSSIDTMKFVAEASLHFPLAWLRHVCSVTNDA